MLQKAVQDKIGRLLGVDAVGWENNKFYSIDDTTFGIMLECDEEPFAWCALSFGQTVHTALFSATPVWWSHSDGQNVVLAWRVLCKLKPLRWGDRYIACKRAGFPDEALQAMTLPVMARVDSDKAKEVVEKVMKKLPQPAPTAVLHGLFIMEVGDVGGLALVSKNADLKI